jgi:hypothetical protein
VDAPSLEEVGRVFNDFEPLPEAKLDSLLDNLFES